MWEIEILFLIEESFKTFAYFLYNFHPLFHMKVSEIPFSNSRLFPHTDDSLFQETLFELVEYRSSVGVRRHVELHPPVKGSSRHYPSGGEGARWRGEPESCLAPLTECCGRVWWNMLSCFGFLRLSMSHQYSLWKYTHHIFFFFLHSFSLTLIILIFLLKHKILKIKKFQLKYLKFLEFKISQNFKFPRLNTLF